MPAERGRWGLVALGLIINLCLGTIYSWSVFVKPLTDYFTTDLGQTVTANEVLMPFSVFLAFFAIAMPFTGRFIESLGPRKVTIIGGVLTGLGWLLASTVTSVWMLYIMYGTIGGIGVGIAYGVPVAVAARWFPDRRGTAVGLTLLGFGFSAFLTANIAGYLITLTGVMTTFRIFGLVFIVLIVLLALPLRFPAAGWRPAGWNPPVPKPGEEICECDRSAMVRTPAFYGLWFCYFIGCLAGLMAISISKPVGTEIGIEAGLATILVGFFAIFNGGGRPLFGALTDRFSPRNTALLSFVLIAGASALLWQVPSVPVYILSFVILWGCLGGWLAIAPTATGCYFGTCDYPRCYGVVFLAYGAGAIAGPQLAGFIKTTTGNYLGVFPYVLVLALIGITVAWCLLKPPKKAQVP
ncbi:MAG TPA: OFA family MFS transporter [Methanoregulaceae archaeon]|nr:MAG: OFA family MFS transporter [Methanolinea sp.]HON80742.1 OFA family MFS transporter [Methanoregulaceae archaeon]HPD09477.1 OFA family MFS transporter [Methanoregulaceae archaeon]HRT14731.1 OFA family MFS transporter [Methanoregulaceae archaeon]HRU30304.1 OFA family MFS transporter [Methanoregulaceae archaeon]